MSTTVAGKPGLDPALPDVSLILGGVERKLCFDYNAIVQAEKATGVNLLEGMAGRLNATNLRGLLWAALLRGSPKITIEEVGELIRPSMINVLHEALIATWFGSIAAPNEENAAGELEAQEPAPGA